MNFIERYPVSIPGIVSGVLMLVHGIVPNTQAMPLVWPAIAGGVSAWLLKRATGHGDRSPNFKALRAALGSGAVSACVALVGFSVGYLLLTLPAFTPIAMEMGATGKLPWTPVAIATIAGVLLLCLPVALVGGLVAIQFTSSRVDNPA